jgi:20S proteasome alpha/beta subunit
VKNILLKEYKDSLSIDDGLKLALSALKRVINDGFDSDRIDCVYITNEKKNYEKMPKDRIAKVLASLDSKDLKKK